MERLNVLLEHYRDLDDYENDWQGEDAIKDVIDIVTGWCSPRMKLTEHEREPLEQSD